MAPNHRPGAVDLPTIGADADDQLPYSELVEGDINEPYVPKPRRERRRWRRPAAVAGALVALGAVAAVAWPSGSDAHHATTSTVVGAVPPTSEPSASAPVVFHSTKRPDGWFDIASDEGAIHLQLPANPTVHASNGNGTVSLVADLGNGGRAELLWAPLNANQPRSMAPFLAMTGAMERYPGIVGSPMRMVDGKAIIDGTRHTATDELSARVTATPHFGFIVVFVEPASMDAPTRTAMWNRILGSLTVNA